MHETNTGFEGAEIAGTPPTLEIFRLGIGPRRGLVYFACNVPPRARGTLAAHGIAFPLDAPACRTDAPDWVPEFASIPFPGCARERHRPGGGDHSCGRATKKHPPGMGFLAGGSGEGVVYGRRRPLAHRGRFARTEKTAVCEPSLGADDVCAGVSADNASEPSQRHRWKDAGGDREDQQARGPPAGAP